MYTQLPSTHCKGRVPTNQLRHNLFVALLFIPMLILAQGTDLAQGKNATASSQESATYAPSMAVDANSTTRWSSQFSDPQWIRIDLGSIQSISAVKLIWEAASAKNYTIDISPDGSTWNTIATKTNMPNGARRDSLTHLSGNGRYIRMNGTSRTTVYGYSLYSFNVYGNTPNPGTIQFAASTGTVAENENSVAITIQRVNGSSGTVSVSYATINGSAIAGTDYTAQNGTLTFDEGVTSHIITIPVIDDAISENAETFSITLSNATGGAIIGSPSSTALSIIDNDAATGIVLPGRIEVENYNTGGEGVGYHDLTSGNTGNVFRTDNVDIQATTDAGGGYNVGWIDAGEWLAFDVTVPTNGNYTFTARMASNNTGTKTIALALDGNSLGSISTTTASGWQSWANATLENRYLTAGNHVLRITMTTGGFNLNYIDVTSSPVVNNGTLQFSTASNTVAENGQSVALTVNRVNGSDGTVTINYATANGSASAGSDYTAKNGTLTFNAGVTSQVVNISITDDTQTESAETFLVNLTNATGGAVIGSPSSATITITDNDNQTGISLPGRIQVEDYNNGGEGVGYHDLTTGNTGNVYRTDNVDIQATTDIGGGYNVGWTEAGEWLAFDVNVATAGTYQFTARMASSNTGTKTITLTLDGSTLGTISTTTASGWQSWVNATLNTISLSAGNHVLRITMTTGGFNLNYIDVSESGNQPPVANAGPDQNVPINTQVTLDGRASHDPDAAPSALSYNWVQTSGTTVVLTGATTTQPVFTPTVAGTYTFTLTVNDGAASSTDEISVTVSDGAESTLVFAVNCGGSQYTGTDGIVYTADNSFTGGTVATTTNAIYNTNDQTLYQSERWGVSSYQVSGLTNGNYIITFKFAETYWSAVNNRVFDVQVENQTLISQLDIYAQAYVNNAYDITKVVTVTDGNLQITFQNASVDQPKICAFTVSHSFGLNNGKCDEGALSSPMMWQPYSSNFAQATLNWEPVNSGRTNSRCLSINHTAGNDSRWEQTVTGLVPGVRYIVRGYVKGTNITNVTGTIGANLCLVDEGIYTNTYNLKGTFDWKPVDFTFTAPSSGTVKLAVRLGYTGSTVTGKVYFDDITMIPTTGRVDASTAKADSIMNAFIAEWNVPGGAIGVVKDGRLVYARGFGYADKENGEVVQPFSLFRLASCSKPITSIALMKLIQETRLDIDAPVFGPTGILNDAIYSPLLDSRVSDITVHQLLQHIAGWGGMDPMFNNLYIAQQMGVASPAGPQTLIEYMVKNENLLNPPGYSYYYSNFGFCILGRVIEKITQQPYYRYLDTELFTPLGIQNIKLSRNLLVDKLMNEVRYYTDPGEGTGQSVYGTGEMVPWAYGGINVEAMDAHGGLSASAPALLKLMVAVDGFNTKPDILNAQTLQLMTTPSAAYQNYACGWAVNSANNWWHNGSLAGTSTIMVRAGNGMSWVILMNWRPADWSPFNSALDNLGWQVINNVSSWPGDDQFNQFE